MVARRLCVLEGTGAGAALYGCTSNASTASAGLLDINRRRRRGPRHQQNDNQTNP